MSGGQSTIISQRPCTGDSTSTVTTCKIRSINVGGIKVCITVVGFVGDITSEEKASVSAAIGRKNGWAEANRPEKYRAFVALFGAPPGRSGREWAEVDLEICREYLEATGQ